MNNNKKVLVTGSSKGIGLSIAKILKNEGYCVFITGRNEENLKKAKEKYNFNDYFVSDLLKVNAPENLIETIKTKYGSIDILVNNAGDYIYSQIEKTKKEDLDRILTLNSKVPFLLTQLVVPDMKEKKWGRIVNTGSISGSVGEANASLYSMTKASLMGLTKALALELAEYKITVNTINPGWVDTELADNDDLKEEFSKEELIDMIPQRRFVHPDEVGNLCKYLVSEEAKGLTGQSINLCAGLSIG